MASSSTGTSKSSAAANATNSKPKSKSKKEENEPQPPLSANFARSSSSTIGYDHEVYLQLIAGAGGKSSAKTANQIHREERTRHLTTRALDPAILEPRGDPSSVDFECAEIQRKKDRFQ